MTFNLRQADLKKLNSLTKYPSIPTYHQLDPANGRLLEEVVAFDGPAIATEKVDGTNARIIVLPDGTYLIGSREQLLYAQGDLIGDPALGIVEALRETAEALTASIRDETADMARRGETIDAMFVYYGEVFGGKVTAASKQYTGQRQVGWRLFDMTCIPDYQSLLEQTAQKISLWREQGGQHFSSEIMLHAVAHKHGLQLTPRLCTLEAADLPRTIAEAHALLTENLPQTRCLLDEQGGGKPEGIVIRTADRKQIAKMRFEDYQRTLRARR